VPRRRARDCRPCRMSPKLGLLRQGPASPPSPACREGRVGDAARRSFSRDRKRVANGADLSTLRRHGRTGRTDGNPGGPVRCNRDCILDHAIRIHHRRKHHFGAAGSVQPRASCQRARPRLSILSFGSRAVGRCGRSAHSHLHDLPLANLHAGPNAGTGNKPIQWNKVNRLPDYVYFDHSIHIAKGVGCTTCHGAVGRMPLMRAGAPLTMGWCLDCHRDPAPNLRPASVIFDPDWTPPNDQPELGKQLLAQYHIDNKHLTDCTVCHR
jgi:hypothetical protein